MIVCILSCGTHWWGMRSKNLEDPFCFRRKAAYFNSTTLMYGRRKRDCHIYPGQLRFNRTSGFDPEFVERIAGRTFRTSGPQLYGGKIHLLFELPATGQTPESYLVTLHPENHGTIEFRDRSWRSPGVQPIAVSKQRERYEAMVLIQPGQWIVTSTGRWCVEAATGRFDLQEGRDNHAVL